MKKLAFVLALFGGSILFSGESMYSSWHYDEDGCKSYQYGTDFSTCDFKIHLDLNSNSNNKITIHTKNDDEIM